MRLLDPVVCRGGRPLPAWLRASDPGPVIAECTGHFALHERLEDGSHLLVRDLLGVHKLFFALGGGRLDVSSYLADLVRIGHPLESVLSVPSGHYVRIHPGARRYELVRWGRVSFGPEHGGPEHGGPEGGGPALEPFAGRIRAALERTFRALAERFADRPVYVTLSGGVDSTAIAALASEHFAGVRAVTFALRDRREAGPGADLSFARRVACDLGIAHLEILADPGEVLSLLGEVLVRGQDYRDFNVHCGLVNAVIGKTLGALHPRGPRPVVLTGDTLNELMADYAPVVFRGREYFRLPALDVGPTRRFLVAGLDSGDREVGIFARFGVETVQPHALCAREYAALPVDLVRDAGSKSRLMRRVMDGRIPEYVLARPKVRAQVAVEGEPGGIMALLLNRGIDQEHLKRRFASLLGVGPLAASSLMRAGVYRFSASWPEPPRAALAAGARCAPRFAEGGRR